MTRLLSKARYLGRYFRSLCMWSESTAKVCNLSLAHSGFSCAALTITVSLKSHLSSKACICIMCSTTNLAPITLNNFLYGKPWTYKELYLQYRLIARSEGNSNKGWVLSVRSHITLCFCYRNILTVQISILKRTGSHAAFEANNTSFGSSILMWESSYEYLICKVFMVYM